jgi:hypothetical protein
MSIREDIVAYAKWWAEPGTYRPTAWDFVHICEYAKVTPLPSHADLRYTETSLPTGGLRIGGQTKQWCGIFAVAVWARCGVGVKWTLDYNTYGKNILSAAGIPFEKHSGHGHSGIKIGDIAFVEKFRHHFIITEVNGDTISTVEGNQGKNDIRAYHNKSPSPITTYYSIRD